MLAPVLTPHGNLLLEPSEDAAPLAPDLENRLAEAFRRDSGHGLIQLGAGEINRAMPAVFAFWRDFASRYVGAIRALPKLTSKVPFEPFIAAPPAMKGAEYLTPDVLDSLWRAMDAAFRADLAESGLGVEDFLKTKHPAWNLVGRVHFNLAENRKDPAAPFAFIATYTHRLSLQAKAQHLPLGRALTEYAGEANRERLLSLLLPVQRAAQDCAWLKTMVDNGEIFHPLRWKPPEAFQLLADLPVLEAAGVIVRVPSAWRNNRPARPRVTTKVGSKEPAGIGVEALLDFNVEVTLDGETLTEAEIQSLLHSASGLQFVRGRWVEVDSGKLQELLTQFRSAEKAAAENGFSFSHAMRLLTGVDGPAGESIDEETQSWSRVVAGDWLVRTLEGIRHPDSAARLKLGEGLQATLRPYQMTGVRWLYLLSSLGLGACLADDMGLGKTMQVLALLVAMRESAAAPRRTSILVAPASLMQNWMAEIRQFAPSLKAVVAHPSAMSRAEMRHLNPRVLANIDLVITSYGSLLRIPELTSMAWRFAVIDEAQAIKNPNTRQTRAVKALDAHGRIALTGTPVENRLADLWSIFDFINPGLLGSGKEFSSFAKRLAERKRDPYAPLRELAGPYILRRLKTDKSVISDLPDKTEVKAFCNLSRKQAALYQDAVDEMLHRLDNTEGIERKGMILSFFTRLKQVCNHPSQWLDDGTWAEKDSGKLLRLREIAEVIGARQEKVLVFTQYREIIPQLNAFLESVFGRPGVVLHGETEVRRRQGLVRQFQEDEMTPFFLLSLKAGGVGLNLTAAAHVIHFDRWWNPAVENQATDRAFRIGQKSNVLVQKFICRGTIEEKIDALIESKQKLSRDVLEGGAELLLTEMSNEELMELVALDIHAALES